MAQTSSRKTGNPRRTPAHNPFEGPSTDDDLQQSEQTGAEDPTGSVSPDRTPQDGADVHAREIAAVTDQQAAESAEHGTEAVSPDRVGGPVSDADREAYDAVDRPTPEQLDADQDAALQRKAEALGLDPDASVQVRCYVSGCILPEFLIGTGLHGGHYALRPDLRKRAATYSKKLHDRAREVRERADAEAAKQDTPEPGPNDAVGDVVKPREAKTSG